MHEDNKTAGKRKRWLSKKVEPSDDDGEQEEEDVTITPTIQWLARLLPPTHQQGQG
jgi:hypothetical protein